MLVVPTFSYPEYPKFLSVSDFPVGLAYIAAALKQAGHEVYGCNPNNKPNYASVYQMLLNELRKAVEKSQPEIIGIGGICIDYQFIRDSMNILRKITDAPIVLGGNIVSKDTEFIFNHLKPDYCVVGEGEEIAVRLLENLKSDLSQIPNIGYWENGEPVFTPTNFEYGDINSRPFPDYEVFNIKDMVDNYSRATRVLYRYSRAYPRPFTIISARSCPFNCTFCVHKGGPRYRARSIENIMAELKEMYERYQFNILIIGDELFAANKKRMHDFCNALLQNNKKYGWDFDWMFQTHASARLDEESLALAKKGGCYLFSYGIESASQKVLDSMNKKIKIEYVKDGIELARKLNIGFSGNLIFGDFAEDESTIIESLEFWKEYGQDNQIFLSLVYPYPGSQFFDDCISNGLIQNKVHYYENINKLFYLTPDISHQNWMRWGDFLGVMERLWLFVPSVKAEVELDSEEDAICKFSGGKIYRVIATCPYCGHEIVYREMIIGEPLFYGSGCTHCHRRLKVYLR